MAKATTLSLSAPRAAWIAMLTAAARAANGRVVQAMGSARLDSTVGGVSWWSTNQDLWRGGWMVGEIDLPGQALLPIAEALAVVKACPDGAIAMLFTEDQVAISTGNFSRKIPSLRVDDFPLIPDTADSVITLPCAILAQAVDLVLPVVHDTGSKYFMKGALFVVADGVLTCVGTDGHQLAKTVTTQSKNELSGSVNTILPKTALIELHALLSSTKEETVTYGTVEHQHVFRVGLDTIIARTIDDKFPAYERIIPKGHTTRIVCDREAFERCLKRVALASDGKVPKVQVAIADNAMTVSAESAQAGAATERVVIEQQGPSVTVNFNADYVGGFLDHAATALIACEIKDDITPLLFRPIEAQGPDYLYLVSPMKA